MGFVLASARATNVLSRPGPHPLSGRGNYKGVPIIRRL